MRAQAINFPYESFELGRNCPECKSDNTGKRFFINVGGDVSVSNKKPVDYCIECGFETEERFSKINFINKRNKKIELVLDGI